MIQIDDKIVSLDIITARFLCDLSACRGICCVEGNSGAPLEPDEVAVLESEWKNYRPYMVPAGIDAVGEQGFAVLDDDGDLTTTLVNDAECAYAVQEDGVTLCAIEKAWKAGKTPFRKPISCHLYPIRLIKFSNGGVGLNYHRWGICRQAVTNGQRQGIPLFRALREPIVRRFGEEFFRSLEEAENYLSQQ